MAEKKAQTTEELLQQILDEQQQHRAEVASLRDKVNSQKSAPVAAPSVALSSEDALAARLEEIGQHDYYCPGCGALYDYRQRCTGRAESPHPPVEVVSTDELKSGDESQHSAVEYVK